LLEPFDTPHDIDQRIHGAHLVQGNSIGRQPMHSAFSLPEQAEGADRPLADPRRKFGAFDETDQLANMAMRSVVVAMVAGRAVRLGVSGLVMVVILHGLGGPFP
jgi:hypothetical protein